MTDLTTLIAEERPTLLGLAYRLLGSVAEAEDAVQEACLRLEEHGLDGIERPGAWLNRVTSRICLDRLRSAQHRRETYVGPWLPEPLVVSDEAGPGDRAELAESLSMAFLLVLEALSPAERVALVMHDVFGYGYDELAAVLDRSEAACRQLVSRARSAARARRPRFDADPDLGRQVTERFLDAVDTGQVADLIALLHPDVVFTSDGGGVAVAAGKPVIGAQRVVNLLSGLVRLAPRDTRLESAVVNGAPGILVRDASGRVDSVFSFELTDGRVSRIFAVRNPHKLAHLE